jgi:type I restriction enzyme S subunit
VSELLEGWTEQALGSIADCRLGKMLDAEKNQGALRPYLRNTNVQWGKIDLSDVKEMRITDDERERYVVRPGDLLVCEGGEPGRCAVWRDGREMYLQKALHRVRPLNGTSSDYLRWFLQFAATSGALEHLYTGSTIKHLPGRQLAQVAVPTPAFRVQERIAERLDELDARRASIADRLATASTIIDRLRVAILASACAGRLTDEWRDEDSDVLGGEGAPLDSAEPFEIPSTWRWSSLDSISEIRGGIQVGAKRNSTAVTREVPYLRVANVQRGWLDLSEIKTIVASEEKIEALRLQPGDIFFNEGGDRDKLGRGWVWEGQIDECIHQNHVFRARLRDKTFEPRFFSWYANTFGPRYFFDEGKQTVNLASLSRKRLGLLPVPVPPAEEQAEIVGRVTAALTLVDRLTEKVRVAERSLNTATRSALATAFRGELVVGDDPAPTTG